MNYTINVSLFVIAITIFMFAGFRGHLKDIEKVNLSEKEIKSRKEGQSLWEWITCSRFKDVIPGYVLILSYIISAVYLIALLDTIYVGLIKGNDDLLPGRLKFVMFFSCGWIFPYKVAGWDSKSPQPRPELWIPNVKTGKKSKKYKNKNEYERKIFTDDENPEVFHEYSKLKKNLKIISSGGTIETLEGGLLNEAETRDLIKEVKGKYIRTEIADKECEYRHIHYVTKKGKKGTIRIAEE